jgi:hypothetical protein
MYCRKCGKEVDEHIFICPYCGFKQKKPKKKLIIVIIIFLIIWIIFTTGKNYEQYNLELQGLNEPKTTADSLYNEMQFNSKKISNFQYLDLRFEEKKDILLDQIKVTALFLYTGKDERKIRIAKLNWEMLELTIQQEILNYPDSYQNKQLKQLLKKYFELEEKFPKL